jgi:stress response protein SCP2
MTDVIFDLTKDVTFDLDKDDALTKEMVLGLSWSDNADVDLSSALVDNNGKIVATASYTNKKRWINGCMYHHGDDLTGSNAQTDTDNEQISLKLSEVPAIVKYIYVTGNVFSGSIKGATVCIRATTNGPALVKSCMGNKNSGLVLARIVRDGLDWKIEKLDLPGSGSTISSLFNIITSHATGRRIPVPEKKGFLSKVASMFS